MSKNDVDTGAMGTNLCLWSKAHVFYNLYNHSNSDNEKDKAELEWRNRMAKEAPNGNLLEDNSLFDVLNKKKIYLLHTTTTLDSIKECGMIYPSGGCLVGCVYCTPLIEDAGRLRLHNLGAYIVEQEAPRSISSRKSGKIDNLVIEITVPDHVQNNLVGIDYLRLGQVHLHIFHELEYLLSCQERHDIKSRLISKIKSSVNFLSICNDIFYKLAEMDDKKFLDKLVVAIDSLPVLGYIYFEVISEYVLLYSNSKETKDLNAMGEFDNWGYKEFIYSLYPDQLKEFNLGKFKPSFDDIKSRLTDFDISHMAPYIKERVCFHVNTKLFNHDTSVIDWQNMVWEFNNLQDCMGPLLGHLVHRELRNFGRYPNFYYYFDQTKALQVWNYWNHMDVLVPFNGSIPKGEVGVNPAALELKYKIYECIISKENDKHYAQMGDVLDLSIAPRLVDLKRTFMRNGCHKSKGQNDICK